LSGIISLRGKVNYTNLSRYSDLDEKTFRRWFEKKLNFIEFNRIGNKVAIPESAVKIAAWDCSFVTKSGKKTYGLAQFWNGKQGKAEKAWKSRPWRWSMWITTWHIKINLRHQLFQQSLLLLLTTVVL
jgi:hypothetical protein